MTRMRWLTTVVCSTGFSGDFVASVTRQPDDGSGMEWRVLLWKRAKFDRSVLGVPVFSGWAQSRDAGAGMADKAVEARSGGN